MSKNRFRKPFSDMQRRDRLGERTGTTPDGEKTLNPIIERLKTWVGKRVVVSTSEDHTEGVLVGVSYTHLNLLIRLEDGSEVVFRNFGSVRLVIPAVKQKGG